MDVKELKKKYSALLNDIEFDELDLGLKQPNIFKVLGASKTEIRHSNFLAWLLDPNESHNLGGVFLKRFLREVFSSDRFENIDEIAVAGLDLTKTKVLREWSYIDILVEVDGIVICSENKVGSKEHSNQLARYKKVVNNQYPNYKKTFVFLTPEGLQSTSDSYHPISYGFIVESLERVLEIYGHSINDQVKNYISDYIVTIKREIMGTDKLTQTAINIYENHRELFDFIIEHRPEPVDRLREVLSKIVESKGWIVGSTSKAYLRFLTPKIKDLVYINKNSNGWKNRESYLLELELYPSTKKITFRSVISPSDENYDTSKLEALLRSVEGFNPPKGKKWLTNYSENTKFNYDEIPELTDEELSQILIKFIDKITPIVEKVEDKFLENSKLLIDLKNV